MTPDVILQYLNHPLLPVVILIVFVSVLLYFLNSERRRHRETRQKLDEVYTRLEQRLYHELDELEKLLREERVR